MIGDHEFALCLTHDVDRVRTTFQIPYHTASNRDLSLLKSIVTSERPYWQFPDIIELENQLGVRSSFYFLNEKNLFRDKRPTEWIRPKNWKLFTGRYDIEDDEIVDVIRELDDGGWEVGLHGSYSSYDDPERLKYEKDCLESILGHEVLGCRQHYLRLRCPETWKHQRDIGLRYDTSIGSTTEFGFQFGHHPFRPFDDEFVVIPLNAMEVNLMRDRGDGKTPFERGRALLEEAARNEGVLTVVWHPRLFNEDFFPGYRQLYIDLIRTAKEMNAWIGPCAELLQEISSIEPTTEYRSRAYEG